MSVAPQKIQEERLKEVEKAFKMFDMNKDGKISKDELRTVMASAKIICPDESLDEFFAAVDRDCNGYIDYKEFCAMIKDLVASPQNLEAKIQLVFRTMDMDNDRKISPTELQLALDKFGQLVTDKEAVDIVNTFDRDNDGYINYDEFVTMMLVLQQCPM